MINDRPLRARRPRAYADRLRRDAHARLPETTASLNDELSLNMSSDIVAALLYGGIDWAEVAAERREDAAAERAMLPRLAALLEGTGARLSVNRDGPHALEDGPGEYDGFFVVVACSVPAWPEVYRRLVAAGVTWINEADYGDGQMVADLLDGYPGRGSCPWRCGGVFSAVEKHAGRCRLRPVLAPGPEDARAGREA